jgi:VanZ family protein
VTWLWLPVIVYAAAIFAASSISQPPMPGGVSDSALHGWAYAGLAAVVLRALAGGHWEGVTVSRSAAAALLATAYGLSDEFHQRFVPGRFFDLRDLLADAAGAAAATALIYAGRVLRPLVRRGRPRSAHDDIQSADHP